MNIATPPETLSSKDYASDQEVRWCPGCGDYAIVRSMQKTLADMQAPLENTVFISGIGCASRFPYYMSTYGFHTIHGRAAAVATGTKLANPDLDIWVISGDGDALSIGGNHLMHVLRRNVDLQYILHNNEIYGLTKGQTSPTSRRGTVSNTHPKGSILPSINPIMTTLGVSNVSFVAQTIDWNPAHLFTTLLAAYEHPGFAFVRILQRCPHFSAEVYANAVANADHTLLITHEDGIQLDKRTAKMYINSVEHDPTDIDKGRELAGIKDKFPIGLFYQNKSNERYDEYGRHNLGFTAGEKEAVLNREFDKYAV